MIDASLKHKCELLRCLEEASAGGEDSYAQLIKQYDSQVHCLEARIVELERERNKLLTGEEDAGASNDE